MKDDIYAQSNSDIIRELGTRFKDYRKRMGLTQKEVAAHTGLSVFTISTFENGTSTGLTLSSFLKMLRTIEQLEEIEKILLRLPESPRELFKKQNRSK